MTPFRAGDDDDVLVLHGSVRIEGAGAPLIPDRVPEAVKHIIVRGQPSFTTFDLLGSLVDEGRTLKSITFEFCTFTNADYMFTYGPSKKHVKLCAEQVSFLRCRRPAWALLHLADPDVLREVFLWCCEDNVLPTAGELRDCKESARFWSSLRHLEVSGLPTPYGRGNVAKLEFSPVLTACQALEELVVCQPDGNGLIGIPGSCIGYDPDSEDDEEEVQKIPVAAAAAASLSKLERIRLWNGEATTQALRGLKRPVWGLLPGASIEVSAPDVQKWTDELEAEAEALADLRRARVRACPSDVVDSTDRRVKHRWENALNNEDYSENQRFADHLKKVAAEGQLTSANADIASKAEEYLATLIQTSK